MNKLYTLALGMLLPITTLAQQEIASVPLTNLPVSINKVEDIAAVIDEADNASLYVTSNNAITSLSTVQLISLSATGEVLAKTKHPQDLFSNEELLGALIKPSHFNFYRYNKSGGNHQVVHFQVEKSTGLSTPLPTIRLNLDSKTKFITSFVSNNEITMLYYLKKPGSIQVVRLDAAGQQHISDIPVDIDYGTERFIRYGNVVYMDDKSAKTVFAGHHQKKVYKQGDKIYFVFDDFASAQSRTTATEILELDLKAGTSKLSKVTSRPKSTSTSFNSYIHKDKLFWLLINSKELQLAIYDLHNSKELAFQKFSKNDPLTLKSTPVYKRGAASIYESDYAVLEETNKALRKMDKGIPAIVVEDLNGHVLQLTIGSYLEPQSGGSGGMIPMGGGTIATPRGPVSTPVTWMHTGGGFYGHGSGVSTYFKSFIHADTFEKVEHTDVVSLQDQIDAFEETLRRRNTKVGAKTIYMKEETAYLAYVDQKEKALKLVKFTKAANQ